MAFFCFFTEFRITLTVLTAMARIWYFMQISIRSLHNYFLFLSSLALQNENVLN